MNPKILWYKLMLRKNHAYWWAEDNMFEMLHTMMDHADQAYWRVVYRIGGL